MRIHKVHKIAIVVAIIVFGMIFWHKAEEQLSSKRIMPIPTVEVSEVTEKLYVEKSESAGRIQAEYSVDVVARINGWLEKHYFKEGAFVKKGQNLFLIEPKEYILAVEQATATTRQAEATYINAEKELKRASELVKNDYVSKSYYDNALAARDQHKALFDMRKAELANAKRNLEYTRIVSPIDGKIGKIYITEGNYVTQSVGKLATIVSTDPIYAYFNLKSRDYVKFKRLEGQNGEEREVKVELRLADGKLYPYTGKIDFVSNIVNETTGNIEMRASFQNKDNMLVPGDYVTVISTVVKPQVYKIIIPQKAVLKGSDFSYVFVVNDENKASVRKVETGVQIDDNWEIISGLKVGEKVITSGLTNIRLNPEGDPNDPKNQCPVNIDTSKQNTVPQEAANN